MPKFLFVYHGGGAPSSPEEGEKVMAQWNKWIDGHGDGFVDGGAPVGMSKTVSTQGVVNNGGANPASGYGIVEAATIEAACDIAKECPIHATGGNVEVAEIMDM